MSIVIVNSGGANLTSIKNAFEKISSQAVVSIDENIICNADYVILPGVGSAQMVMQSLISNNLVNVIKSLTQPVLGICVGMQILFNSSEEQNCKCLGLINDDIKKFNLPKDKAVPHMGWNKVIFESEQLLSNYYYFANSYYAPITKDTTSICEYGIEFSATVQKDNFFGCQFHPEKSSNSGIKFIQNFLNY